MHSSYTTEIYSAIHQIPGDTWNALIWHPQASPFIRHEYLLAMEQSACVSQKTGWQPCHFTVWQSSPRQLLAAMPFYLKTHSYGEYVFDWAWANAYQENGLSYYPKMLSAIPFTPVGGTRILGNDPEAAKYLLQSAAQFAKEQGYSSIHVLFPMFGDQALFQDLGYLRRESIQFHWQNQSLEHPGNCLSSFEEFLYTLNKKRRNNILRERSQVQSANVKFIHVPGSQMTPQHWETFYACYETNYLNHGNKPYLNREFFSQIGQHMPDYLHLIFAIQEGTHIAASLLFRDRNKDGQERAYGRYWGSTKFVSNLHFETAYYQSIEFCIQEKIAVFEGGAQGEHKIHRGLLPVNLFSMHYLLDDRFGLAVENYLKKEGQSMRQYLNELEDHQPIKQARY